MKIGMSEGEKGNQNLTSEISAAFIAKLAKLNKVPDLEMRQRLDEFMEGHEGPITKPELFRIFSKDLGKGKPHGLNKPEGEKRGKGIW